VCLPPIVSSQATAADLVAVSIFLLLDHAMLLLLLILLLHAGSVQHQAFEQPVYLL
jgi:hypothetical protein